MPNKCKAHSKLHNHPMNYILITIPILQMTRQVQKGGVTFLRSFNLNDEVEGLDQN